MVIQGRTDIDRKLAESLKELGSRQPIEKITIKDITDKAGVIRPTFYNHFQDKYELLEWIMESELLEPLYPMLQNGMMNEAMVVLFTSIQRDKAFYTRVVKMEGSVSFQEIAQRSVKKILLVLIEERTSGKKPKCAWLTPDMVASYYAQSMCFITEGWIRQGMMYSPQEMSEAYQYMISHSMEDVINDF